ncbi:MAG: pyridoxal phosphate-dependent aminotransferase [Proteobacteria bacterium]|nr:pyridoxal phosphate-dependent aminotransferase [Pseudomonadota bacterium]MCP4917201.1 pyridoxal phosphate-dependent aminotransferase [Pseudomonadota bacterium]
MPRPPQSAPSVAAMSGAVFSRLAGKIRERTEAGGEIFPLHVGDTYLEPFVGGRMQDLSVDDHPGMHRYSSPQGLPSLVDAAIEKVRETNRIPCERGQLLVTAGATGGLGAAIGSFAAPGEEILILAPFWPLIRGIVQTFRATPVEVPFYDRMTTVEAAIEAIRSRITERTVAIYVSTPSNPTGRVIPPDWLAAIADEARRQDLWILSDEIYEQLIYRGEHASIATFAPERTFTAFSFSKAFGMAGNRTGYLVGPATAIATARKISTHTFYSAPTSGQLAGLRALRDGDAWLADVRSRYQAAGDRAAELLGEDPPQGSTFLFLDMADQLDERGIFGFLEDCLDEDGLLMAPGPSFGAGYETHVRVCTTSAPPAKVEQAVQLLRKRIGR